MKLAITSVGYAQDDLKEKAFCLAESLRFTLEKDAKTCLFLTSEGLTLKVEQFSLLSADFSCITWQGRRNEGKKQGIVRACKPMTGLKIIDATAGWGRDAAILASFGAEVLMLERHPVMAALLHDALLRQSEEDKFKLRLSLLQANACNYLKTLVPADYPDVIYLDPMHPTRNKSALVKKDMQVLQQMIGMDQDVLTLIEEARRRVKQRVVVKWPQKTESLLKPDASIEGKTVRYDLYLPKVRQDFR